MGVTLLQALPVGNAIRVYLNPEPGAVSCRVLRRTTDIFTGPDDQAAVLVADECTDDVVLDVKALVNGTTYFYRAFSWDGSAWTATPSMSATPAATYAGDENNPQSLLVARLEAGFAVEVARGALKPSKGRVPVYTSPFLAADALSFPNCVAHLDLFEPSERLLGEEVLPPEHLLNGEWQEFEGFLARWHINLAVVAQSADERGAMRGALIRILEANLPVFAGAGLILPQWSLSDSENTEGKDVPLFMSGGTFSCLAMSFVGSGPIPAIRDLPVSLTALEPNE